MNRNVLACATLLTLAGAASAQSVAIGGYVDLGVGKRTGTADKGVIDGGGAGGSRMNFKVAEDLGGGMKAYAALETRFNPDTGEAGSATNFWAGYSYVGLDSGRYGRLTLGRWYTAVYLEVQGVIDPFAGDTVATLRQTALQFSPGRTRYAKGARYDVSLGGVSFAADVAESGFTPAGAPSAAVVNKPWSFAVTYGAGPLFVGIGQDNPGGVNDKITSFGARYAIGDLTLRAGGTSGTNNNNFKVKGALVGATYAMGPGLFKVGYAINEGGTAADRTNNKRFAVGYQYNLSKRTYLYTDFVRDSALAQQKTGYDFGIRQNF